MKTDFNSMPEAIDSLHSQLLELKELVKTLAVKNKPEESDSFSLDDALKYINGRGLPIQKSTIYKMVSSGTIPHRKMCGRLIFFRDELDIWFNNKLTDNSLMTTRSKAEVIKSAQTKFNN